MALKGDGFRFLWVIGVWLLASHVQASDQAAGSGVSVGQEAFVRAVAVQQIEYLRKAYAKATDRIGENTPKAIEEGRGVYKKIFTPDVVFKVKGDGVPADDTIGGDNWVKVVADALKVYAVTQHLIGTQLVDIDTLELDAAGNIVAGHATMTSYLQAWHATPDDQLWLFIGTYYDQARFSKEFGWQIYSTTIERVSGEERPLGVDS